MKYNQSGNVLFYILIAVALLAALSYAVTQSGRSSLSGLTSERLGVFATEIIEYGNIVSQSVSQIRLRGNKDTEISFENNIVSGYVNANCTDDECKIFHVNGGGVNYSTPKTVWLDNVQSGELLYGEIYFHGETSAVEVGTDSDDLIMFIPYIRKDLCIAINKKLGIKPVNFAVPLETSGPFAVNIKFTGSYGSAFDKKISGDGTIGESDILYGKMAGCTEASGTASTPPVATYHYYQVLIAR